MTHHRGRVVNQWVGMKREAWPPVGHGFQEEPQLNAGWSCAVNNGPARNCLLLGRKECCVLPETLSLGAPQAEIIHKNVEPPSDPYPFRWPRSNSVSCLFSNSNTIPTSSKVILPPRPYSNAPFSFTPDPLRGQTLWSRSLDPEHCVIKSFLPATCPQTLRGSQACLTWNTGRYPCSVIRVNEQFTFFASSERILIPVPFYFPASILSFRQKERLRANNVLVPLRMRKPFG